MTELREGRPEPRHEASLSEGCGVVRCIHHSDLGGWQIQSGALFSVRLPGAGPLGSLCRRFGTVQHESTATGLDSGGLVRTS